MFKDLKFKGHCRNDFIFSGLKQLYTLHFKL